ncbi:MAG: hypothetical protein SPE24_08965 [Erysipelotrichaceae bacterium]|nr:hypothetical protein [Erysipelotrichaceae bacterium]
MRRNFFDNHEELCEYMIDKAQDGMYSVAVLFYDDAIKLIREMMMYDDIEIEALEIKPYEYDGYDKEYYVSLADDMVASVEPAFVGDRYLDAEADLTLIDGNANSAILKHLQENKCHEIYIGENEDTYDDCCEECDDCHEDELLDKIFENAELIKDSNGKTIGINVDAQSVFNYLFG